MVTVTKYSGRFVNLPMAAYRSHTQANVPKLKIWRVTNFSNHLNTYFKQITQFFHEKNHTATSKIVNVRNILLLFRLNALNVLFSTMFVAFWKIPEF